MSDTRQRLSKKLEPIIKKTQNQRKQQPQQKREKQEKQHRCDRCVLGLQRAGEFNIICILL